MCCSPGQETFLILTIGDKNDAITKNWLIMFNYIYIYWSTSLNLGKNISQKVIKYSYDNYE